MSGIDYNNNVIKRHTYNFFVDIKDFKTSPSPVIPKTLSLPFLPHACRVYECFITNSAGGTAYACKTINCDFLRDGNGALIDASSILSIIPSNDVQVAGSWLTCLWKTKNYQRIPVNFQFVSYIKDGSIPSLVDSFTSGVLALRIEFVQFADPPFII